MSAQTPSPSRKRLQLARILIIVFLGYAGWCGILMFKQSDMIFPRAAAGPGNAALARRPDCERLWITAPDGVRVEGWFFRSGPVAAGPKAAPRGCVLVFHGNTDLIDNMVDYAEFFLSHGLHVLLVEYRGYARSGGMSRADGEPAAQPGERDIVADSLRFVELVSSRADVDPGRLIYYGRSLGTGVAAQLAARRRPAAVILESPFVSVASLAAGYGVPGFLGSHPFRTDRALPPLVATGVPVLILSSRDDEIIPFAHGQRLAAMMPTAKFAPFSGSHNALPLGQPVFERAIVEFLESIR